MAEEWSVIGGLQEQRTVVDGSMLHQHDGMVPREVWNSKGKERSQWQGKKQPSPRGNRQLWPKKSTFCDPEQGTSAAASCRDRLRNIKFTEEENDVLVTKVLENYPKLYGEDASRTSSFEKKRIWRGILESINGLGVSVRNVDTCKKRFADCKRFVRAKMSKHWRLAGKRQSLSVYYADWEEKIKAVICPLVEGIPGLIDSANPCTYECPGHWSPHENASPEGTLTPEETTTSEVPFYPETQMPTKLKPESENAIWPAFHTNEEESMDELEGPSIQGGQQHKERMAASCQWVERQSEGHAPSEMDHLLHQSQEAFRRTMRRQLHAVRQELREFRRDHTERMDLLLTLHREHLMVEEQKNEILSQLVSTVNNLVTKLSPMDTCKDGQNLQHPLAQTSTVAGENSLAKTDTPVASSHYLFCQSPEHQKGPTQNRRRRLVRGQFSNKRRK
ncbi:uncharacterized protein LOC128505244 [Spea bombifrons]|uniref:uncharacterized protein LOC128505244 n=1 Tax=Spea bombifrons TaxID=233779 RepID=UPI00234946C4|nr:uncharacterized protein LOC128505244 [Spea bombifrons]